MANADLLFETDFELYCKAELETLGFTVFHSVYVDDYDAITTQVDLIAVKDYTVFVVECKSHYSSQIKIFRSKDWIYLDQNNRWQTINNPVRQNKRHLEAVHRFLLNNIESPLYDKYGFTAPFCQQMIIFKGLKRVGINTDMHVCNYNNIGDMVEYLGVVDRGREVNEYMHELLFPLLRELEDDSKERLKEHKAYIEITHKSGGYAKRYKEDN